MLLIKLPNWMFIWGYGLTLYKLILVNKSAKDVGYVIAHEACHVKQWTTIGFLKFPYLYIKELVTVGYYKNKYEVEARRVGNMNKHKYKGLSWLSHLEQPKSTGIGE